MRPRRPERWIRVERSKVGAGPDTAVRERGHAVGMPRRPPWLLDRERLFALLDGDAAVTRVVAPAGAGKSALLIGWADRSRTPITWINAARQHGAVAELLEAGAGATSTQLARRQAAAHTLVIDNADHLDVLTVNRLLDELDATPTLRLVVIGRDLRRFGTPAAQMRHAHVLIGPEDLDFTLEETIALLRRAGVTSQDDTIRLLHTLSSGNAAVLRAAMITLGGDGAELGSGEALDRIIDLVASTIIPSYTAIHDDEFEQFLFDTAVAETMDRLLATELSGVVGPEAMLDRAVGLGLGSWLDDRTFAYSGAARLVLRQRAERRNAARVRRLGNHAARWAREHGRAQAAFRLAITSGDFTLAGQQLRDDFFELVQRGRDETRALLENVPPEALRQHPALAYHLGVIYSTDRERRTRANELFASVLEWLNEAPEPATTADRLLARAIFAVSSRLVGRPVSGVAAARDVVVLTKRLTPAERADFNGLPGVLAHCGLTLLYAGEYAEALDVLAESAGHAPPFSVGRVLAMTMTAAAQALIGETPEAEAMIAELEDSAWPENVLMLGSRMVYLAAALVAIEHRDLARARGALTLVAANRERFAPNDHWELNTYVAALVDIAGGRPNRAIEVIAAARAQHRGRGVSGPLVGGLLTATRATAELAAGHPSDALATLDSGVEASIACAIARARVELAIDQPAEAIAGLAAIETDLTTRQRAEATAIEVAARLRLSATHAAVEVPRLMAIMHVHGLRMALELLPQQDIDAILAAADPEMLQQLGTSVVSLLRPADVVHLSPRELVVLGMLAQTGSTAEIAEMLYVSVSTVKTQLRSIYRKLGVKSRSEALARAAHVAPSPRPGGGATPRPPDPEPV